MNEDKEDQASVQFPWLHDGHVRPRKSLRFQNSVSDLEEKTKVIFDLIQGDDGDSFARRAEMYYERRPDLIKTMEDLMKSYRSLAENYNQLSSECSQLSYPRLNSMKRVQFLENPDKEPVENPGKQKCGTGDRYCYLGCFEGDKKWNKLKSEVAKLIEENLQEQKELIKRNNEKRQVIRDLCSLVNRLKEENRNLKSSLPSHSEIGMKRSQSIGSRLKGLFL